MFLYGSEMRLDLKTKYIVVIKWQKDNQNENFRNRFFYF